MAIHAPLSWLREYVDIDVPIEELARRLTLAGIGVESVTTIGAEWENIFTGHVARLEQHPNADRLKLATVEYGADSPITVVTGAPNIEQGQKVVLGLLGSRYLDQHVSPAKWSTLKPAKIRGIQTEGMVMSEAELGISEEHEGIIILDAATPIGLAARDLLGDTILEIDVTPNNGRIMSMIGLAREIAALFGTTVRYPSTEWQADGPPAKSFLQVNIDDPDLCPRYTGTVIQNVHVGPSPAWMQRRLSLAGMRPINNVVDITNYVMLEMGQPMHPFSYRAVEGGKIIVRRARDGEKITTLDHVERSLDSKMLVIADANRPVALAGVMGGADSEIEEGPSHVGDVLLESAHFEQRAVRRTARLFKLPSEAASRFERFVDPNLTVPAMKRAAELMRQLAGGTIAQGYVDNYPRPRQPVRLHFYTSEVERLLGIKVPPSQMAGLLGRLEFKVDLPPNADAVGQDTTMLVDVPSYRNDVTLPADLVEEVARMVGYDLIPETLLDGGLPPQEVNHEFETEERVRDLMTACGIDEVITYNVTNSESLAKLARFDAGTASGDGDKPIYRSWDTSRHHVTIVNPLSVRQDVMRPSMLPNLLDAMRLNLRAQPETPVRIFEVGRVFMTRTEAEVEQRKREMEEERERYPRLKMWEPVPAEERLPLEARRLSGMMSGPRDTRSRFYPDVEQASAQIDFFDAKGVIEELMRHLYIENVQWSPVVAPLFHPGRVAMLLVNETELGVVGEMHPSLVRDWDLPEQRVCAWDLDLDAIMKVMPQRATYSQVSPYQPVRQDMAFVVDTQVPAAVVSDAIKKAGGNAVTEVSLFDIYSGKPIPEGKRSLAFAVTFSSTEKPLTEEEVARLRKRIAGGLSKELQAEMRT